MDKIKFAISFVLFFLSCSALAMPIAIPSLNNIEISAALGPNWSHANNTHLIVSPFETDSVLVNHVTQSTLWKLGVGYRIVPRVLLQLNFYQSSETIRGNVWEYQLPQFNNYRFSAPIVSTRLMLDLKPDVFTYSHAALYPILGTGIAWNEMTYQESNIGGGAGRGSNNVLGSKMNTNIAYDLGAGIRYAITTRLSASLEYLYTHVGNAIHAAGTSATPAAIATPPSFNVYSQSILFGINWKIA